MAKRKIHPHLKHFIHEIVMSSLAPTGSVKENHWKEEIIKQIEIRVLDRLDEIKTTEDLKIVVEEQLQKFSQELKEICDVTKNVLVMTPIEVLVKFKN